MSWADQTPKRVTTNFRVALACGAACVAMGFIGDGQYFVAAVVLGIGVAAYRFLVLP